MKKGCVKWSLPPRDAATHQQEVTGGFSSSHITLTYNRLKHLSSAG